MKNIIRTLIAVMALALVLVAFSSCEFPSLECEHDWTEATCTAPKTCSLCGLTEGEALGHNEEVLQGKDATCAETGLTEGKKCSVCGETVLEQEVIPEAGHKDENKDYECDDCHIDLCTDHVPAEAVKENEVPATCSNDGSYESVIKCAQCGEEISRESKVIEKLSHTEEVIPGYDETCTEAGRTDGKKCTVCGEVLIAQQEIPATHISIDGTCTRCGLIDNVFSGKTLVPASDAAGNIYSASFGYNKIIDGDLASRYSSKKDGGKVEATIDLGAVYELSKFRVLLYEYNKTQFAQFGTGMEIYVLFGGEWTKVVDATAEEFNVIVIGDQNWLTFDLGGVVARQVKFVIPSHGSNGWSTFWEIECSGKASSVVEPEPEEPVLIENIFAGKQFTPTDEALASVLAASWWQGGGYETLTDGIKNADNAPGRFSTVMSTAGFMDATIDLGGAYELHSLKFYTYDPAAGTGAGSVGANLLIQVYANGEWIDVVTCADNATLYANLVVSEGTYNDYLEFDLGGIVAEKVRFYISASASSSGTTYEEIECNGYAK